MIGFSVFYLQLYRDSNSAPLRFEANAMLIYNAHPVRICTKGGRYGTAQMFGHPIRLSLMLLFLKLPY